MGRRRGRSCDRRNNGDLGDALEPLYVSVGAHAGRTVLRMLHDMKTNDHNEERGA